MDENPTEESRPEGFRVLGPDPEEPAADDDVELPHWTEPGTGEVPAVDDNGDEEEDLEAWQALGDSEPRWRDESVDYDDFSDLRLAAEGDDLPGPSDPGPSDPGPSDPFSFDDIGAGGGEPDEPADFGTPVIPSVAPQPQPEPQPAPAPAGGQVEPMVAGNDRNLSMAAGVGAAMAGIGIIAFFLGPEATVALVTVVLVLAAAELFENLRRVGYQPATLLGLASVAGFVLAAWWRGEAGYPLVLALTLTAGLLWYLFGVGTERPVPNLGVTLLGVLYVGGLGSFAALLLDYPHGVGMFVSVIICVVAYDIAGYFVGRSVGRQPLSAASPNKTIEGLIGGFVASVAVGMIVVGFIGIDGFGPDSGGRTEAVLLGIVVGIAAPLGDLAESMIKRDLGVKDMGTILPGHGGLLDRFDGLLFALPAAYYLARVLEIPVV